MQKKDYYEILGIAKNADKEEIKKAYHRLAHKHHPDKTQGDEQKFKEINEAYQVLINDKKEPSTTDTGEFSRKIKEEGLHKIKNLILILGLLEMRVLKILTFQMFLEISLEEDLNREQKNE